VTAGDFEIQVDEPIEDGGEGTGPAPTALLLASVASCFTLALAHVARKRGVELGDVSVQAIGRYDGPKFGSLAIEVSGSLAKDELERLTEIAARVCYVSNTLAVVDGVDVSVVEGAATAAGGEG
jgi:putative redox protein